MKYKKIMDDTFNISKRIKNIDKNYIIKWNYFKSRYEIFYSTPKKEVLELVLPFKDLDYRTIEHLLKTKRENLEKLTAEIEKNNKKLEITEQNKALDEAQIKLKEMLDFIEGKGNNFDLNFDDAYKTKWV
ncbi:MAG: hypothetical protein AB7S44_00560 [Spirochaetales bacterium]